jgi:hypothetical protein
MVEDEFLDGADEAPSDRLELLKQKAQRLIEIEETIKALEDSLAKMSQERKQIRAGEIPDLMAECGLAELPFEDYTLKLSHYGTGSLPKEDVDPDARKAALKHLEELGGDGLMKNTVSMQFGKKEHNIAKATVEYLRDQGFDPVMKSDIHPQTLYSFVREAMASGKPVDQATLGVEVMRIAKVNKKKK